MSIRNIRSSQGTLGERLFKVGKYRTAGFTTSKGSFMRVQPVQTARAACLFQTTRYASNRVFQSSSRRFSTLSDSQVPKKDDVKNLNLKFYGDPEWAAHFGSVEKAPPPPEAMTRVMKRQDPISPGKSIAQTHVALWIPAHVNSKPYTINALQGMGSVKFSCYLPEIKEYLGDNPVRSPYWALLTRDLIPGSCDASYKTQEDLVKKYGYEPPHTIEAVTYAMMEHAVRGTRLFQNHLHTSCAEVELKSKQRIVVGRFEEDGIHIRIHKMDGPFCGMIGVRRFDPANESSI